LKKYFGTDGIRRIANTDLTPELVYKVAKAGAYVLAKHSNHTPTILIGRDTRISGTLIESAMTAGFLSYGANVKLLGVIPTPAVAYLTKKLNADASVVISASHNTFEFNGVKFFSNKGMKIPDDLEEEIEEIIDSDRINELIAEHDKIGVSEMHPEFLYEYADFIINLFKDIKFPNDFKVAVDTANGATYKVAEYIFEKLGINYKILSNKPDGININKACGSTHLENLKNYVTTNNMSLGIAYDGDGDRCLAVDELGNEINGDLLLATISKFLKKKEKLNKNTIVATVMSNLGLKIFTKDNEMNFIETKVGDRYVLEEMLKNGYNLGGEQSGHIILLDYNPTGDGILTSLMFIRAILEDYEKVSDINKIISIYPQVLVNAKVKQERKYDYSKDKEIQELISEIENEFSNNGRVLIRTSGTEPLIRVMIEGKDVNYIDKKARKLADLIEKKLN
jgi:phosphoglucosamine mutase